MRTITDIIYSETNQTVEAYTPKLWGGVTATVHRARASESDTAISSVLTGAAIDSVATTVDANSGAGQTDPTLVNLAATTNIAVGRQYVLTDSNSREEWVTVAAIDSGNGIYATAPLLNSYVNTNTFKAWRVSATVDSTWVADSTNMSDDQDPNPYYRITWTNSYGNSSLDLIYTYFDLVRFRGATSVTPADMCQFPLTPDWLDRVPTWHRDDGGQRLIDEAYRDVKWRLHAIDRADETVRSPEVIDQLVRYRALVILESLTGDVERRAIAEAEFNNFFNPLIRVVSRIPSSTDTTGASENILATPMWSK
jgi:hypothetical protein